MRFRCLAAAIVLSGLCAGPCLAQQKEQAAPPPQQAIKLPEPEVLLVMIRSALIGLDHANRTGNYSMLRELGGPLMQRHTTGVLSNAFAGLRSKNVDLLPAAIVTPQLTQPPVVTEEGLLQMVGFVPAPQSRRIEFEIVYQAAAGQWRLAGMSVGLTKADPAVAGADGKAAPAADAKAAVAAAAKAKAPAAPAPATVAKQ